MQPIQNDQSLEIISPDEFLDSWRWLIQYLSVNPILIEQHSYHSDHKYMILTNEEICIDQCEEAVEHVSRLFIISTLEQVSNYLAPLINNQLPNAITYHDTLLDADIARVINSTETENHQNAFRNSLSEHLAHWVLFASIVKNDRFLELRLAKPNLQPEDKGPDGLALIVYDDEIVVRIISVKNSIGNPKRLISSASLRNQTKITPDSSKLLDEFYAFTTENIGFSRLDEKLHQLGNEIQANYSNHLRRILLFRDSQYCGIVLGNESRFSTDLFEGFVKIANDPHRCHGIYIGSIEWKEFAQAVQEQVQDRLRTKGVDF